MEIKLPELESTLYSVRSNFKLPRYGGIYALYSKEKVLLYIGKTTRFNIRIYQHLQSEMKPYIKYIEFFKLDNEYLMELYETYLINEWKPLFNKSKVFTYSPLIDFSDGFLEDVKEKGLSIRMLDALPADEEYNEGELCAVIDNVLFKKKWMGKSDLRSHLASIGYNVEIIMSIQDFEEFLYNHDYPTNKMSVFNRLP